MSSPKSAMGKSLCMVYSGAKFVSFCGPEKLENQLSPSKIQLWDRHRITVIDFLIPKWKKWKKERSHGAQAISNSSRENSIRFPSLEIILRGLMFRLLGSRRIGGPVLEGEVVMIWKKSQNIYNPKRKCWQTLKISLKICWTFSSCLRENANTA